MSEIINEANKIIEGAQKDERKEKAFDIFKSIFALSGLVALMDEDVNAMDKVIGKCEGLYKHEGYTVKAEEKELESKFMLAHVIFALSKNKEPDHADKFLREHFDNLFWNKCVFDKEVQV